MVQTPHIGLEMLQEPKDAGRLAVPNPLYYYMAPQLQHLTAWHNSDFHDPIKYIFATLLSNNNLIECLEAGEFGALSQYPTHTLIDKIWCKTKLHLQYLGYMTFTHFVL